MQSIEILKPGVLICDIGKVIEEVAAAHDCSVVNIFVGHGVGLYFHEPPQIPHHLNRIDVPLVEGMTFTIEPMINAGIRTTIVDSQDHWTARTADDKPSAQWEHTLLITPTGYEILTSL
jgi:methionyl aminopeptidase